jgi:stringent starvation protein B
MLPDVNQLARFYFDACRNYLSLRSDKVHIFVRADKLFKERYPFLTGMLSVINGVEFIILNVGADACRDLAYHDYSFSFSARFKGVAHTLEIHYGDVIGMGEPGAQYMYDFATIPLASVDGGNIALRPLGATQLMEFEQERKQVMDDAAKLKNRPKLVAVK